MYERGKGVVSYLKKTIEVLEVASSILLLSG
jgi:hypothetical protein